MRLMRTVGVSLPELLVGLTLFGLVGSLLLRTSLGMSRALGQLQARAAVQATFDVGAGWLRAELEEVGPDDLRDAGGDTLRYRAIRFAGLACNVTPTEITLVLQRGATGRSMQPGRDSLLLPVDSTWQAFPLLGVSPAACGTTTGLVITTAVDSVALTQLRIDSLSPVRIFEAMQARFYASGAAWWLGGRSESAGEGLQPLAGPFLSGPAWEQSNGSVALRLRDTSRTDSAHAFVSLGDSRP